MSEAHRRTHIKLTDARRERVLNATTKLFAENFDERLSEFRREALLDFFIKELGAPVYNQAIQRVRTAALGPRRRVLGAGSQRVERRIEGQRWNDEH